MSLTTDDLQAIKKIIDTSVAATEQRLTGQIGTVEKQLTGHIDGVEKRLVKRMDSAINAAETRLLTRIDNLDETLSQQVEQGLEEVRSHIRQVQGTVDKIERIQKAEIQRDDLQDKTIRKIRTTLKAI